MKKLKLLLGVVLGITVLYFCNKAHLNYQDKQLFIKLTGISKFEMISDVRESQYFYMVADITPADKKNILRQHYFKPAPINLNGNLDAKLHFLKQNDYLYYLEDFGHGYLGYVLYLVSKREDKIIVYTNYAD